LTSNQKVLLLLVLPLGVAVATNMTIKGQVLIPKHIREAVGLVPGKPVAVVLNNAREAVVRPAAAPAEDLDARRAEIAKRIRSVRGMLSQHDRYPGMTTDDFMRMIRGEDLP
jgi:antitoxin PrlF